MLASAVLLLREGGMAGVTVEAVLAHSAAPRGSVYHHFPGGREELLLGALRQAGAFISAKLEQAVEEGDPQRAVESLVRFWKRALTDSGFRAGCPVLAATVDSRPAVPGASEIVREIFSQWQLALTRLLITSGHGPARAGRLATMTVAAIEGAIVLCRAQGDVRALDDVAGELAVLLGPAARSGR